MAKKEVLKEGNTLSATKTLIKFWGA